MTFAIRYVRRCLGSAILPGDLMRNEIIAFSRLVAVPLVGILACSDGATMIGGRLCPQTECALDVGLTISLYSGASMESFTVEMGDDVVKLESVCVFDPAIGDWQCEPKSETRATGENSLLSLEVKPAKEWIHLSAFTFTSNGPESTYPFVQSGPAMLNVTVVRNGETILQETFEPSYDRELTECSICETAHIERTLP